MIPTILFIGAMLALAVLGWLFWTAPIGFETDEHGWLPGTRADYPELFSPTLPGHASGQATGRVDTPQRVDPAILSDRED